MKTIGLISGMSWESTVAYYQIINRLMQERLSGFHSASMSGVSERFPSPPGGRSRRPSAA